MLQTQVLETIDHLSKLYASGTVDSEADDLKNEMILAVLEYSEKNPEFLNQKPAYIVAKAKSHAFDLMRACTRYEYHNSFVGEFEDDSNDSDDNDDSVCVDFASDDLSPEEMVILKEEEKDLLSILDNLNDLLSGKEFQAVAMSVSGFTTGEIAENWGVSQAAVSQYKRRAVDKIHWALEA